MMQQPVVRQSRERSLFPPADSHLPLPSEPQGGVEACSDVTMKASLTGLSAPEETAPPPSPVAQDSPPVDKDQPAVEDEYSVVQMDAEDDEARR